MLARQLPRVISMHDVPDVEYLCASVVSEVRRRYVPDMPDADAESFLAFCLGEIFILKDGDSRTGRPGFDTRRNVPFRLFAYGRLRQRLLDELRSPRGYGRTGEGRVYRDVPGEPGSESDADAPPAGRDSASRWMRGDESVRPRSLDRPESPGSADPRGGGAVAGLRPDPGSGAGAAGVDSRAGGRRAPNLSKSFLDCAGCGWRHYRDAPNGVDAWHFPERCRSCDEALRAPCELVPSVADGDGQHDQVAA